MYSSYRTLCCVAFFCHICRLFVVSYELLLCTNRLSKSNYLCHLLSEVMNFSPDRLLCADAERVIGQKRTIYVA